MMQPLIYPVMQPAKTFDPETRSWVHDLAHTLPWPRLRRGKPSTRSDREVRKWIHDLSSSRVPFASADLLDRCAD